MLKKKQSIGFYECIIDLIFIVFFAAHYLLPSFYMVFYIPMAVALVYCLYMSIRGYRVGIHLVWLLAVVLCLAVVYTVLTDTKTISADVDNGEFKQFFSKFNQYLMMYFPLLLSFRLIKVYSRKIKTIPLVVISLIFVYVFGKTFVEIWTNPGVTRHWGDFTGLAGQNIGSYDFVYAVPIIICVLASCNKKFSKIGKIINVFSIILMFIFLINADYTLALLITLVGVILVGFSNIKSPVNKFIYVLICLICVTIIPSVLKLMYTYLPAGDISLRVKEIYNFVSSGDSSGYNLNSRLSLYRATLQAFANSPIVGNRYLDFDGHGTFITVLSDTGIMGAIPMFILLFAARKYVKNILGEHNKVFTPVFIVFVLMGIVNPIHATDALSFTMWCVAPLIIDYFFNKENITDEK
ncbi:MAG: hypothetical protein IKA62_03770 [Clostridia bacterium]|nr:hypothetical protein [Clostridia bacterium]